MLRSNGLISPTDQSILERWLGDISYQVAMLLDGADADAPGATSAEWLAQSDPARVQISEWDVVADGPLSEAAVRLKHQPAWHYRISANRLEPGADFGGAARAGFIYVLAGASRWSWQGDVVEIHGGQIAATPAGEYRFTTRGETPCEIVRVWLLPPAFRIRPVP